MMIKFISFGHKELKQNAVANAYPLPIANNKINLMTNKQ